MQCGMCKGSGKLVLECFEYAGRGLPAATNVEINCIWCKGTGHETETQVTKRLAWEAAWCSCGPAFSDRDNFSDDGRCSVNPQCKFTKHHYHCGRCGKVSQEG